MWILSVVGGGGYFASLRARALSREPLFASPWKIPAKKSKNGCNILIWYLYVLARPLEENVLWNRAKG